MNSLPLVSVGAINYNNAAFVLETLESIRNQSYPNIELIIVDDHSTDNSVELITQWLKQYDKPYKLIVHEGNQGVCATSNDALNNSSGVYFTYIATDDVMLPHKVEAQVALLEKADGNTAAVYSDALLMKEDGSPRYGTYITRCWDFDDLPEGDIYPVLLESNFIPAPTIFVRKEVLQSLGGFDENLTYEDYDMWLRMAQHYKFLVTEKPTVTYRIRKGSLTHSLRNWDAVNLKIYSKHLNGLKNAADRIDKIAYKAYMNTDKAALNTLVHLPQLPKLSLIIRNLVKKRIPPRIGIRLLRYVYKSI